MTAASPIPFDNSYVQLPERFYVRQAPTPVRQPGLIKINDALARDLGIDPAWLASPEGIETLAGNRVAAASEPLATAYAGHQFGGFSPQLGDGRAVLLGEVVGGDGHRRDIQLKGAGPTAFSRRGDGRAALGPVLREYLVSEAMAAVGVPTTRALAAVTTGEPVIRETVLPGAVLARVAASHIRVGTFQFFAARGDVDGVRTLADHVISRHYPAVRAADNPYLALLDAVMAAQASLVAQWLGLGFIHGVMNTDNMSIAGETIDYGPCAFMDTFRAATVYSSIDRDGRYAYGNQPRIALWNLARLAETLLPLFDADEETSQALANGALERFSGLFNDAFARVMRRKLGLTVAEDGDLALAQDLLQRMEDGRADFTLTFRGLADAVDKDRGPDVVRGYFQDPALFDRWADAWGERLARDPDRANAAMRLRAANVTVIPRNHLVEEAIAAATSERDFRPFEALHAVLQRPFDEQPDGSRYTLPPKPEEVVEATFCGT